MSDPKRLLETGDDFERELLGSAVPDRGSDRVLQRTLLSIGAGTAITVASTATANAAASVLAAPSVGASVVLKWLGIGAAAGLVTAGSVDWATHRSQVSTSPPASTAPAPVVAQARVLPSEPKAAEPGAPVAASEPAKAAWVAPPGVVPAEVEAATPSAPSIGALPAAAPSSERLLREVRVLDRAKSALARGDAGGALAALDEHARSFPRAALGLEADVLRVRASIARGNRSAALVAARRVIAAQPDGAHARAVKALFPELE